MGTQLQGFLQLLAAEYPIVSDPFDRGNEKITAMGQNQLVVPDLVSIFGMNDLAFRIYGLCLAVVKKLNIMFGIVPFLLSEQSTFFTISGQKIGQRTWIVLRKLFSREDGYLSILTPIPNGKGHLVACNPVPDNDDFHKKARGLFTEYYFVGKAARTWLALLLAAALACDPPGARVKAFSSRQAATHHGSSLASQHISHVMV
jgi:hypothetical protein